MVSSCAFCGIKRGIRESRTYHKFPLKDKEILQSWLQNMGLGPKFVPTKHSVLCSDHFEKKCFQQETNNKCLRTGSIPTLFKEYKSICSYCHAVKGQDKERSFRKFLLDNPKLLEKWIAAMKMEDFVPSRTSLLCSHHFDEKCFRSSGHGLILRANAIPTLFSSAVSEETFIEMQEDISNSLDKVNKSNNQSVTWQGTKRHILSETTSPSKIQKSGESFTNTSMHSEKEVVMDCLSVEYCDESTAPSTSLFAERKENSPLHSSSPNSIKKRILNTKHDHQYETSPTTTRKKCIQQQKRIHVLTKKTHILKKNISRLKKKVISLNDIVKNLRETRAIPESGLDCLDSIANTDISQFLNRFINNNKSKFNTRNEKENNKPKKKQYLRKNKNIFQENISKKKYPAALRSFAMTLHFYSPKAYDFVRKKFCKALPHPSTLRSWYSAIDGSPGFSSESFTALKQKVASKECNKKILVALMLDEISIKKSLQRLPNGEISGHVDFGSEMESSDNIPLAKDALVMMVVSLDES